MDDKERKPSLIEQRIGAAVLLLLLIGSFAVMLPFLSSLTWAFVMAFALWPVERRLVARLKQRRTLAAMLMTLGIALVLVLPTIVIVVNLSDDARALGSATKRWIADGPPAAPSWLGKLPLIGNRAAVYWDELATDATQAIQRARDMGRQRSTTSPTQPSTQPQGNTHLAKLLEMLFDWLSLWVPLAGLALFQGVTQILLSVFLTFFIFRDGEALGLRLVTVIRRIAGVRGEHLLEVAGSTVRGVVYGILGTALVQAVMASVGFLIAGVPGAALLGLITFFASPIPIGPPLIWIPATLWLFHQGQTGWGIFMLIWGVLVSSVDNIVKPWIISQGSTTPFILILFGVIGGALTFGFIGVFLGPTLLAVAYRMIEEWSRETALIPDR